MTCIVGLISGGRVFIGGDSAGVSGYALGIRADKKVFRTGDFIMGFTSSYRMGQLLAYSFKPPLRDAGHDVFAYMVTSFVDAVRDCLKAGGYAKRDNEAEKGGEFLVGYAGRLFSIHEDYQVGENVADYAACGCGGSIALGSLYSTEGRPAEERIQISLEAAQQFNSDVRAPFSVESI